MAYNDFRYLGAASGYTAAQSTYAPMGIGGVYDTPGYGEGHRPLYGESAYDPNNPWYQNRSVGHYIWNASNPIGPGFGAGSDLPYYENASMHTQYAGNTIAAQAPDAFMNTMQQYAMPFASYYAGYKIHQMAQVRARGAIGGVMGAFTGHQAPRVNLGTALGERIGMGAGRAIGAPIGLASQRLIGIGSAGSVARGVGMAGSLVGGAIGAAAAPAVIGMGIMAGLDSTVFQPYIDTRRVSQAIQTNMSNRMVTGSNAAPNYMMGMSATAAATMGSAISNSAWDDFGFSNAQYSSLVDYGMQGGLYGDMGSGAMSARNMVERTKKLAMDVKKVMEVFGEKDMREAVGLLSQFAKQGGITGSYETTSSLGSLRMGTMMTGKSAREIYDVVGAAGSMSAQSGGMSGIAGVMAATSTYAGLANAQRMGLVSGRMLSLLGGLEGATGLATNAKVSLGMSDYNRMALYSQFYGGGSSNNIMDNVSRFANLAGRDPLAAAGNMALHGQEMRDAQMRGSPLSVYRPMMQMLESMYPGRSSFNEGQLAAVMKGQGMDDASIKAAMLEISAAKRGYSRDVLMRSQADASRQYLEGSGWSYFGGLGRSARYAAYNTGQTIGHLGEFPAEMLGRASDAISGAIDNFRFGKFNGTSKFTETYSSNQDPYAVYDLGSMKNGLISKSDINIARRINEAATGVAGDEAMQAARRLITSGGSGGDVTKVYKMLGEDISSTAAYDFALNSTAYKSRTHTPSGLKVRDDDDTLHQLSLISGEKYGTHTNEIAGVKVSPDTYSTKKNGKIRQLKAAPKSVRDLYYAVVAAKVQNKSPDKIAEMLNSQDPETRAKVLKILDPYGPGGGTGWMSKNNAWFKALDGGHIPAGILDGALNSAYGIESIDAMISNPELAQDMATRVGENSEGKLYMLSEAEQHAGMKAFGTSISGDFEKGTGLQSKYVERLSNVKRANADVGDFKKLMMKNVASLDGSGDGAARTMAIASGTFKNAVMMFAETAAYTAKGDVAKQIRDLVNRSNTSGTNTQGSEQ